MWIKNNYEPAKAHFLESNVNSDDKKLICRMIDKLLATKIKHSRAEKYYIYARLIIERGWLGTYQCISEEDLYRFLAEVEHSPKLGAEAKRDYKIVVKRVLEERNNPLSEIIKTSSPRKNIPRYFLTVYDVLKMLKSDWKHLRDKAIMACLYEGNFRPHEFFLLTLDDVRFEVIPAKMWDGNGGFVKISLEIAWVTVSRDSKTGARPVPLVFTVPWLKAWLKLSIQMNTNENRISNYIWTELRGARAGDYIEYPAARKAMKGLAKSAGIDYKKLQLYSSRRGRNTELSQVLSYSQHCLHAGW
ncbi:MAG: hypothetical protein O8C56_12120, partial [Candidatus Methanoperedens sp.]|nr:hypothetical protein [Candidatus Methanoperedens sp.]